MIRRISISVINLQISRRLFVWNVFCLALLLHTNYMNYRCRYIDIYIHKHFSKTHAKDKTASLDNIYYTITIRMAAGPLDPTSEL